jgi:hypothetical protein
MEGSLGFLEVKPMPFGSVNDGGQGDLLMVGCPQAVFNEAVVIGFQGNFFVLDDFVVNR